MRSIQYRALAIARRVGERNIITDQVSALQKDLFTNDKKAGVSTEDDHISLKG